VCGIIGKIYFNNSRRVELSELKQMTNAIRHRGPDDEGYFIDNNIGMGFRRLSIIDLKSGHQPLCDSSERYWISFNGEVYNFQKLRKDLQKKGYFFRTNTDTEVIVNLYAEYKEKCLDHLRGMFAFVIWDKKEKILFGARDRFGIKPFIYYLDNENFVWGSEIKSIIASNDIDKEISIEALDYYFAYGYSQRNKTIYKQIKKLEPAHYFILKPFENKELEIKPYWEIHFEPDYSKTEKYWKEALYDALNEAVRMRMISDVPLGAFLSGGIDSSTVVALMAKNSSQPIKTFSIGFKEEKYNELQYASLIAKRYKTEHHEMIVEPESIALLPKLVRAYDEPFADSSAIPTYYVSKFARKYVKVVLSGDGGDELFAGYSAFAKMIHLYKNPLNNAFTNNFVFKNINKIIPDYLYGKGYSYYLSKDKNNIGAFFCIWKDYEREKLYNDDIIKSLNNYRAEADKLFLLKNLKCDFLSRMQGLHIKTYLVDDILTKVDRASMMNSLETRVPMLDHKFAELSFRIPSDLKLKKNNKKYILKKALGNFLPNEIINHKKQGFSIPLSYWFKDDLKDYVYYNLTYSNSKILDYFNTKTIINIIEHHQKGMRDYSGKLWSLLVLNEWLEQNN